MAEQPVRHILSLSGGKDSAALAIYMRDRMPDMEYIFHDTDKELPETYEYLARLGGHLGKRITKTTAEQNFDHWLTVFGGMIPSNHRRWCTKMLKLKPFEKYVGDSPVINYVALRADEKREGYISHKPNITTVYPFRGRWPREGGCLPHPRGKRAWDASVYGVGTNPFRMLLLLLPAKDRMGPTQRNLP